MAAPAPLTVRDIVANASLGLTVVVPGDLDAVLRGAHTIEIERPSRWLEPGWLMLTTGLRFRGAADSAEPAELIRELQAAKVAGLAFGIGVHFQDLPPGLVTCARELQFTLLTVAYDVPFLQVESFINRADKSVEIHETRRALWIQTELLDALSAENPLGSLITRIGQLTRGFAVVYDETGATVAVTGAGPVRLIWDAIRARDPRRQQFSLGRWSIATRPIVMGGMGYWIAIGSQRKSVLDELSEPILDSTQRLLSAIQGNRALQASQARAETAELLATLHQVVSPTDVPGIWNRLGSFRFRPQSVLRAFVTLGAALPLHAAGSDARKSLDSLAADAQRSGLPIIFQQRESHRAPGLAGLAAESGVLHEWLAVVSEHHLVGLSEPFNDVTQARRSFRDAERASWVAQRRTSGEAGRAPISGHQRAPAHSQRVVRFEDVDLVTWLLSSRGADSTAKKIQQHMGGLLERPELVETVVAYLAADLDIQATAARLFMHPNSVRYRLRRIEELLHGPLGSPAVIANLFLAFSDRLEAPDSPEQ